METVTICEIWNLPCHPRDYKCDQGLALEYRDTVLSFEIRANNDTTHFNKSMVKQIPNKSYRPEFSMTNRDYLWVENRIILHNDTFDFITGILSVIYTSHRKCYQLGNNDLICLSFCLYCRYTKLNLLMKVCKYCFAKSSYI